MRFKLEIICCILFSLSITLFAQENKSFNFKSNSIWMFEDYYNRLIQEQSPQKLYDLTDGLIVIKFNEKENSIQFFNLHGVSTYSYSVINSNMISVIINYRMIDPTYWTKELIESTITFEENNGIPKLIFENRNEKKVFVRLNARYHNINDVDKFINDCLITGNYVSSEDTTMKVSFASDGTLKGIGKFDHYIISITSDGVPKTFNTISFDEINWKQKVKNVSYFYWEKKDNRVILYRTSEPTPDAIIQGKFIELIKVR